MLWNTDVYRKLKQIMPEESTTTLLEWVSKHPRISRMRGLRGMALDMEHRKAYLSKMIHAVDQVTTPSEYLRDVYQACGVSRPIRVVLSGHDLTWLETLPEKKPTNQTRIGYIGQITPIKGLHTLLSAFITIALTDRAQLSIFGDPHTAPEYMRRLETLMAGKKTAIKFCGSFPHERLGEVLSEIDVLVVPSQWHENNPRVIQEAFASKTPVIASNVGGIAEFVQHEVNGLLFERGDVDDLAHQLRRIVEEPGLLERLRAGVPPVRTIEEEVTELEVIYQDLTARK
jgi:glycosyltransferase involved in cell wall biosynthesis